MSRAKRKISSDQQVDGGELLQQIPNSSIHRLFHSAGSVSLSSEASSCVRQLIAQKTRQMVQNVLAHAAASTNRQTVHLSDVQAVVAPVKHEEEEEKEEEDEDEDEDGKNICWASRYLEAMHISTRKWFNQNLSKLLPFPHELVGLVATWLSADDDPCLLKPFHVLLKSHNDVGNCCFITYHSLDDLMTAAAVHETALRDYCATDEDDEDWCLEPNQNINVRSLLAQYFKHLHQRSVKYQCMFSVGAIF